MKPGVYHLTVFNVQIYFHILNHPIVDLKTWVIWDHTQLFGPKLLKKSTYLLIWGHFKPFSFVYFLHNLHQTRFGSHNKISHFQQDTNDLIFGPVFGNNKKSKMVYPLEIHKYLLIQHPSLMINITSYSLNMLVCALINHIPQIYNYPYGPMQRYIILAGNASRQ